MSEAEDWEGTSAWLEDLLPPAVTTSLPCITDAHGTVPGDDASWLGAEALVLEGNRVSMHV